MFSKILVATDGSQYSDKAIDVAIGLAKVFNSSLYIIHVVEEDKVAMATSTMPIMVSIIDDMVKAGNEILSKAKAKAAAWVLTPRLYWLGAMRLIRYLKTRRSLTWTL